MPLPFENLCSLCLVSLWQAQFLGDLGCFGILKKTEQALEVWGGFPKRNVSNTILISVDRSA